MLQLDIWFRTVKLLASLAFAIFMVWRGYTYIHGQDDLLPATMCTVFGLTVFITGIAIALQPRDAACD